MFEPIFIILVIVVCFLLFLVILEISKCEVATSNSYTFIVCKVPMSISSELRLIKVNNSLMYTYSMGFEYGHVSLQTDLHTFVDFITQKLYKYNRAKSMILRHIYFVKCTFQSFPDFDLYTPPYKASLIIVNLDENYPLLIKNENDKKHTILQTHMMAFTQLSQPNLQIKISGNCFLYAFVTKMSTLDYY